MPKQVGAIHELPLPVGEENAPIERIFSSQAVKLER